MSHGQIKAANQSANRCRTEHSGETLLSSGKTAWEGISLEHLCFPAIDISDVTPIGHHLTLQLGTPKTIELKVNGRFSRLRMIPSNVCITPAQHLHGI